MTWIRILYSTPAYIGVTAAVVMALLAWLRGGPWERLGAGIIYLCLAVAAALQDRQHLMGPQYGFLAVDLAGFLAFTAIALRSRLWWATWAAGFMLFSVSIHVAMIVDASVSPYAYYLGAGLCTYLLVFTVIVGTLARRPLRWDPVGQARKALFRPRPQGEQMPVAHYRIIAFGALAAAIAFGTITPGPGSGWEPPLARLWAFCLDAYHLARGLGRAS